MYGEGDQELRLAAWDASSGGRVCWVYGHQMSPIRFETRSKYDQYFPLYVHIQTVHAEYKPQSIPHTICEPKKNLILWVTLMSAVGFAIFEDSSLRAPSGLARVDSFGGNKDETLWLADMACLIQEEWLQRVRQFAMGSGM